MDNRLNNEGLLDNEHEQDSPLNREELRALVVKYKNKGYSYVEISELLKNRYGIKRDRQAIYGIYTRAMKREMREELDYEVRNFIIGIQSIGYNALQITELAHEYGHKDLTYYKVRNYCNNIPQEIKDKNRNKNIDTVIRLISDNTGRQEIIECLSVYGVQPTEASLDDFISEAVTRIIAEQSKYYIELGYSLMSNKDNASKAIKELGRYIEK